MTQICNIIIVLASNLTYHHKQQWNNSQLQRSLYVDHEVPIYNIKKHTLTHKHMLKTTRLKQISGPTFSSLFRSCWKRICSTWRVCSSFLSSLFLVSCSLKWVKAWIIKGKTQSEVFHEVIGVIENNETEFSLTLSSLISSVRMALWVCPFSDVWVSLMSVFSFLMLAIFICMSVIYINDR